MQSTEGCSSLGKRSVVAPSASSRQRATIRQRRVDLQEVVGAVRGLDGSTPGPVERAMARYLTVRATGYIEAVRDDLADMYAEEAGHRRLHRRITHHLRIGQGVAPEQLLTFVGSFDAAWRSDLQRVLDQNDQDLKQKLGAMVAARKKIAHGDGDQVTTSRALAWADAALEIGSCLEAVFAS